MRFNKLLTKIAIFLPFFDKKMSFFSKNDAKKVKKIKKNEKKSKKHKTMHIPNQNQEFLNQKRGFFSTFWSKFRKR